MRGESIPVMELVDSPLYGAGKWLGFASLLLLRRYT